MWKSLVDKLCGDSDLQWMMMDSAHVKGHQHGTEAKGGSQAMACTKGGSTENYIWSWIGLVIHSRLPTRFRKICPYFFKASSLISLIVGAYFYSSFFSLCQYSFLSPEHRLNLHKRTRNAERSGKEICEKSCDVFPVNPSHWPFPDVL
jgi:hypothetical protein